MANVDDLANSITPELLLEWQAVAVIDGWFNGWSQTAEIMAMISNESNRQLISQSSNPESAATRVKWKTGYEIAKQMTDYRQRKAKPMDTYKMMETAKARYGN